MNHEQAKIASFNNGFDTRLQQLMVKSARATLLSRLPKMISGAASSGFRNFKKRGPFIDVEALPVGGGQGRMSGMVSGARNWMTQHPDALPFGAGALGGGGAVYAGNAYGDAQRRKAVENMSILQRLGLAYQLATNPQGFSNTLRL